MRGTLRTQSTSLQCPLPFCFSSRLFLSLQHQIQELLKNLKVLESTNEQKREQVGSLTMSPWLSHQIEKGQQSFSQEYTQHSWSINQSPACAFHQQKGDHVSESLGFCSLERCVHVEGSHVGFDTSLLLV